MTVIGDVLILTGGLWTGFVPIMARFNKRNRLHQIYRWLSEKHPIPHRVRLRVERVSERDFGECAQASGGWIIRVNPEYPLRVCVDSLIHEYAHARYPNDHHSSRWGIFYAQIYQDWARRGYRESRNY